VGSAPNNILLLPLAQYQLHYQSLVPLAGDYHCLQRILVQEGVCEVVLYPLERMPFGDQRSDFSIPVNILHDLMDLEGTMKLR